MPEFKAVVLIYGVFDVPANIERAKQTGTGLSEPMAQAYVGASYPAALNDPRVSPLRGISKSAMPASIVICGAVDDLLPDSLAIAQAMKEAGIEHELHIMDDMPHAFMQMGVLSACENGFSLIESFLRKYV